jgi:hypothetical protein
MGEGSEVPDGFRAFTQGVLAKRDCGFVTSTCRPRVSGEDVFESADGITAAHGFMPLDTRWRTIDESAAREVLQRLLEQDLAYDADVMTAADSAEFARQWLGLTTAPRTFLTNADWTARVQVHACAW